MQLTVDSGQLPLGWTIKNLGELCDIARGGSPRPIKSFLTDDPDGINWIKIGDASASSKYIYKTKEKIKPEGIKSSRLVSKGDFLLSNSMSFGYPYIMKTSGCIHDGWLVLKDKSGLFDQDYLYYYLGSKTTYKQFDNLAAGSTVRNLNTKLVQGVKVVLPPLPEQKKIVAILDEAFEGIDRAIANTEKNLANARELFESYLNAIFTQKGDDWVEKNLGEVYTLKNGINFNKNQKGGEGILTIDVLNMYSEENHTKLDSLYRVDKEVKEDYILECGDILFVRSSVKREGVGWTAYFPGYAEPVTFCGFIIRAKPVDRATISSEFLVSYFRASTTREKLIGRARQATITNISQNLLFEFPISYPNWTKQTQITAKLNNLKEETQRLEAIYQRKLEALQELKQSILHKAFTGELTNPQVKEDAA